MSEPRDSGLGMLASPHADPTAIDVSSFDAATVLAFLSGMLRIRLAEEEVGALVERGLARAPCHLGIGQEAIAVGVSHSLSAADRV